MEELSGQFIKGYAVTEHIGSGSTGTVYQARQATTGRSVAIKIIHPELARKPDFIRSFQSQAHHIAQLDHRSIAPLQDYWRDADGTYLVSRLLHGNLRAKLAQAPFDLEATAHILEHLAAAIDFAHQHGVVHQALKPENILFDEDNYPYLVDFSISAGEHIFPSSTLAEYQAWSDYRAPEQIRGDVGTASSDIYTLGLILYEMLAGKYPFTGATPETLLEQKLNRDLPPLDLFTPDFAHALNQVLQQATAKTPADRFANAISLSQAFHAATNIKALKDRQLADTITPRELEILQHIIDGKSNSEIAQSLVIELTTVKWYVKRLFEKLQVHKRQQAIQRARDLKLASFAGAHPSVSAPMPSRAVNSPSDTVSPRTINGKVAANPYKGLRPFQIADSATFFGRERLVHSLLEQMAVVSDKREVEQAHFGRFLAIIGSSGSGKSSLVRAGLIPALWRGELPDSSNWFFTDMVPGRHPLAELTNALTRIAPAFSTTLRDQLAHSADGLLQVSTNLLPPDERELLLFIDQFEEVFTLTDDEQERTHFLNSLLNVVTHPTSRVRVIITLRADFYDRPLEYREFGEMLRSRVVTLLPMSPEELEQTIVQPAHQVGVEFETGLVAEIITTVNNQPGALPLLEYALTELFEHQTVGRLTRQAYTELGGVIGALSKHADALYGDLTPTQQIIARDLFLRLVTIGEGVEDTRRRVLYSELFAIVSNADAVDDLIDLYTDQRLLTIDRDPVSREPTVELAHEALLRRWERLRTWVTESRADLRIQRQLMTATAEWQQSQRNSNYLATGGRLMAFEALVNGAKISLSCDEQAYVQASSAEQQKQVQAQVAQQQRVLKLQRARVTLLSVSLVVAICLSGIAVLSWHDALIQSQTALARQLAAQAVAELANPIGNDEFAALLAIRSLNNGYDPVADNALVKAAAALPLRTFAGHTATVYDAVFSPDGHYLLTASGDQTARLWDANSGEVVRIFSAPDAGEVYSVAYAPDGETIATSHEDQNVRVWNAVTGALLFVLTGHTAEVQNVAYSPDGRLILSIAESESVRLWDIATGYQIRTLAEGENVGRGIAFAPDGNAILTTTGDQAISLWDTATGQLIRTYDGIGYSLAFAPDGQHFVSGSLDNTATVWETETGRVLHTLRGHSGSVRHVAYSPDGQYVLTSSSDRTSRLWSATTGEELHRFRAHLGRVWSASFSPNGQLMATTGADSTVKLWHINGYNDLDNQFVGHEDAVFDIALSPDGTKLASGSADGTLRLWSTATGEELSRFRLADVIIYSVAFAPSSEQVLFGSSDGTSRLWDIRTNQIIQSFHEDAGEIFAVAISPDGRFALTGSSRSARLWDISSGQEIRTIIRNQGEIYTVNFSPNGQLIVTGSDLAQLTVWNSATGQEIVRVVAQDIVYDADFSSDGKRILAGYGDGIVRLWDIATGVEVRSYSGASRNVFNIAFSSDGQYIAASSADRTAYIWDTATGELVRVLGGSGDALWGVTFTVDSQQVITSSLDHRIDIWPIDIQKFVNAACHRLTRDLSDDERQQSHLVETAASCPSTN
ncbi:MAG: protein kinase [Chloroflexi bacterium]|nr:protein kinase [Chloroflexota bacterium]